MADIDIHRAHHLGVEDARAAAERMVADLGRKFGLKGEWRGNLLAFERPGLAGSLVISAKELHLKITLGFLLSAMRASIESAVVEELDRLFAAKRDTKKQPSPATAKKASPPRKRGG